MKRIVISVALSLLVFVGCSEKEEYKNINLPEGTHRIIVKEHMNAAGYTYILADDNGKEQWLAILEMPVQDGDTFYYSDAIEMTNFKSKTLDKTFESIMFVNSVSKTINNNLNEKNSVDEPHKKPEVKKTTDIKVNPLVNGKTVALLFKNKKELQGKTVKLRGIVTKYNPDILNKNWIHIQDGTSYKEEGDILVTSKDKVKVGDTVIVEGTLVLDKDFGAGYFYKVLIENAKVVIE
jgi:hypothetical protein